MGSSAAWQYVEVSETLKGQRYKPCCATYFLKKTNLNVLLCMKQTNQHPEVLVHALPFCSFCFNKAKSVYWGCLHPDAPHNPSPPGGCISDLSVFMRQAGVKYAFRDCLERAGLVGGALRRPLVMFNMLHF